jgi:DNA-binding NarL/FixJ family response regulator
MVKTSILRHFPGIRIVEASNGNDALHTASRFKPGLIFTEIHFQGGCAMDLPRRLHRVNPEGVIAVLTSYDLPEYRQAVVNNGVHYFISKSDVNAQTIKHIVKSEMPASIWGEQAARRPQRRSNLAAGPTLVE